MQPSNPRPRVSKKAGKTKRDGGQATKKRKDKKDKKGQKTLEAWQDPNSAEYDEVRVQTNAQFQAAEAARQDRPVTKGKRTRQAQPK